MAKRFARLRGQMPRGRQARAKARAGAILTAMRTNPPKHGKIKTAGKRDKPVEYLEMKDPMGSVFTPPYSKRFRKAIHDVLDWYLDTHPQKRLHIDMSPARFRKHPVYAAREDTRERKLSRKRLRGSSDG